MIISFSGLGGSGKTTQISLLVDTLKKEGKDSVVIALREQFIFPKLARLLKRGDSKGGLIRDKKNKKNSLKKNVYLFLRDGLYVLDALRIRCCFLFIRGKKVIIFDRSIDDFILELGVTSPFISLHRMLEKIMPSPTLSFFFSLTSKVAYDRKPEDVVEVIESQYIRYEEHFSKKKNAVKIIASESIEQIRLRIYSLVQYAQSSSATFSIEGYALYMAGMHQRYEILLDPVLAIDSNRLLACASRNRMTFLFLMLCSENEQLQKRYWLPEWNEYFDHAKKTVELRENTTKMIGEILMGINYSLIKNDLQNVEISSDVDIIFFDKNTYNEALKILKQKGRVHLQNQRKADVYIEGMMPIDLHLGSAFGALTYVPEKDIENKDIAPMLITIGHAVAELTIITIGDCIKVKHGLMNPNLRDQGNEIASNAGWGIAYREWISGAHNPTGHGYRFPHHISVYSLIMSRIGLYLHSPKSINSFLKECVMIARAIRARSMGKIPFHDEWINLIDR